MTADLPARVAAEGHLAVDLLDDATLEELRRAFAELDVDETTPFIATCNDLERRDAARTDARLRAILGPALDAVLPGWEPFLLSFIAKGVGPYGPLTFHQDLTYTDERTVRPVLLWAPLDDVDEDNGALQVVPGSHRWTDGIRPAAQPHPPTEDLQDQLAARAVTVPMRAGRALAYDAALIHGSTPNRSDRIRTAVAVALAPAGAELLHFHHLGDGRGVSGHRIDAAYYTVQSLWQVPEGYPEVEAWTEVVTAEDIAGHLDAAAAS